MVGDDVFSDVQGARRAGLAGVLVQTGKYRRSDLTVLDTEEDHANAGHGAASQMQVAPGSEKAAAGRGGERQQQDLTLVSPVGRCIPPWAVVPSAADVVRLLPHAA